ncbi:hypothetical protein MPER_12330, partial [Moniliophthora perniciosa FA553]
DVVTESIQRFSAFTTIPIARVLIKHGLFPTAPSQPRAAISIPLLDFYHALFERSCDAITALSNALQDMYARRGFPLLDEQVSAEQHDPEPNYN